MHTDVQRAFGWVTLLLAGSALILNLFEPFPSSQAPLYYIGTVLGPLALVLLGAAQILSLRRKLYQICIALALPLSLVAFMLILLNRSHQ